MSKDIQLPEEEMNNLKVKCPRCNFEYTIPLDEQLLRTIPQNKLYWPVYVKIVADHCGYFPDEMHEEYKLMFNAKDSKTIPGAKVGGSTTRMTRKEFSEYLEKIRFWAQQTHGIILPDPEKTREPRV